MQCRMGAIGGISKAGVDVPQMVRTSRHGVVASPCFPTRAQRRDRQTDPTATRASRVASRLATHGLGCILQALCLGSIPLWSSIRHPGVLGEFYCWFRRLFQVLPFVAFARRRRDFSLALAVVCFAAYVSSFPALRVLGLSGGPCPGLFMDTPAPVKRELSLAGILSGKQTSTPWHGMAPSDAIDPFLALFAVLHSQVPCAVVKVRRCTIGLAVKAGFLGNTAGMAGDWFPLLLAATWQHVARRCLWRRLGFGSLLIGLKHGEHHDPGQCRARTI